MTMLKFLTGAMLFLTVATQTFAMDQDFNLGGQVTDIIIDTNFFERCKKMGRSPNDFMTGVGDTALILTCKKNQENFVQELIQARNLKVNSQDRTGNTALHYACLNGNGLIVKMLLSMSEIDINIINLDKKTARDLAFEKATKTYDDNEAQKFFEVMQMLGSKL